MNQTTTSASCGITFGGRPAVVKRIQNGLLIGIPLAGSVFAVIYLLFNPISTVAVVQLLIWYVITGVGIGVGFHRHFTHQSFKTYSVVRLILGIAGSLAFQGSVIRWIADHRRHHKFSDRQQDTHTPHGIPETGNALDLMRNLWYAHVGWMFDETTTDARMFAPDLLRDSISLWLTRWYVPLCILSLYLPYSVGYLIDGSEGAFQSVLLAGCLRTTLLHNVIWAVNSIGHKWGNQPSGHHDHSRNNWMLAALTFGEGWHNNHHASPRCAYNNWRGYEIDINGCIIRVLKLLGLAWDVREKGARTEHSGSDE